MLRAPGTTRIASARIAFEYHNKLFAHHCLRFGLRVADQKRSDWEACRPPTPASSQEHAELQLADPAGEPTAKELYVELAIPACAHANPKSCEKWVPDNDPLNEGAFVRIKSVDLVLVDDDDPVVTPSGAFYELDGTYIDGRQIYPLRVDSEDAGSGVTRMDVEHTGWPGPQPALAEHATTCDPHHHREDLGARLCPERDAIDLSVDTRPMPEGTRRFRAHTPDVAANTGERRWTVIIDRTPPGPPQDMRFATPEEGSALAGWNAAEDPILPDGTRGSGIGRYEVRHRLDGGGWSGWERLSAADRWSDEVYDRLAGTRVDFEVRAVDAVGNVGPAASTDGSVFGAAPRIGASGRLAGLAGGYIGGELVGVTINADDTASLAAGVRRAWLERLGAGPLAAADAGCTPRTRPDGRPWKANCPLTAASALSVDSVALPEGANRFQAHAVDRPGNHAVGAPFHVLVDRTPPPAPTEFDIDVGDEGDEVDVTWYSEEDPDLPDGNPGSGLEDEQHRFWHPRLGWSAWQTGDDYMQVADALQGDEIIVEARTIDEVGNASPLGRAALTIPVLAPFEWTDDPDEEDPSIYADDEPAQASAAAVRARVADTSEPHQITLNFSSQSADDPVAVAAGIPCDDMTARECSRLRARMARAYARAKRIEAAKEAYIQFAADFATWVGAGERLTRAVSVIYRPGFRYAVNALIRNETNREGARLLTAVRDRALRNLIKQSYRPDAKIGKGSTADAVIDEIARRVPYGAPGSHYKKAQQQIRGLNTILRNPRLSARERQIATNIRGELWGALPSHRRPKLR